MDATCPKPKPKRLPKEQRAHGETSPTVLIRSTRQWAEYLDEICRADGRSRPNLIEMAVRDWALTHGHPAPPPRV